jgi:uncharacterized ParB-like nuclease family protein
MNNEADSSETSEIEANQVKVVRIDRIIVAAAPKSLDEDRIVQLMQSILAVGLLQPILVAPRKAEDGSECLHLVAGRHRLEAVKRIGLATIKCTILQQDGPLRVQLAEVDENLVRAVLTAAQHALLTGRRKQIITQLAAQDGTVSQLATASKQGDRRAGQKSGPDIGSIRDQAHRTGESKDRVQRSNQRFEALGSALLTSIVDTALDKGTELDALAKLPNADRENLARRAASGEEVSAKKELRRVNSEAKGEPQPQPQPQPQLREINIVSARFEFDDWAVKYALVPELDGGVVADQIEELQKSLDDLVDRFVDERQARERTSERPKGRKFRWLTGRKDD